MDNKKNGIPKLRFPGFTGAWEQRKWADSINISNEMVDPTTGKFDDMPHIAPGNIESFTGRILDNVKTVKEEELISGKFLFKPGDVVFGKINPQLGKYFYARVEGLTSADSYVLNGKNKNITQKFIFLLLQTRDFFKYSVSVSKRSGIPKINREELNGYKFLIPYKEEQEKIGDFFLNIDSLITLHQRKLEHLQEQKKGLLQKMFPKNGEIVPEVRFPGFTDAWEQRKLGEVVKITMGQSPSSKNYTDNSSDYILVQGNADMKNGRVVPRVWTTQITRQAEKGDLILSVRAPVGDIGKTDYDVVIGRGVAAIKGNEYIFQILTKMNNSGYWTRFSTGSTFESINSSNIRNAQIMIPKDDEQTKIGHFLSRFDSLIALHQRKLDHLELMKKGLLQQMFV